MNSDWRALLPYVDEGGIIVHTEQKTKMGSEETQRECLDPGWRGGYRKSMGRSRLGTVLHRLKDRHRVAEVEPAL